MDPFTPPKVSIIDVMLDLETIGLCDNAVITQIAAAAFSFERDDVFSTFNAPLGVADGIKRGMKIDGDSMCWWYLKPDLETRKRVLDSALNSEVELEPTLKKFAEWIAQVKKEFGVDHRVELNVWGAEMHDRHKFEI